MVDPSFSWNLTFTSQGVKTQKVAQWKQTIPTLGKVPAVFVIHGAKALYWTKNKLMKKSR
ncbi:MAG: hypothetical protein KDK63_01785 [Chlamydiia bacterium]|nr:hypothetical protein [Chlamydiia bacterium]